MTDTAIMTYTATRPQAIVALPTAHVTKRVDDQVIPTGRIYITATYSDVAAPATRLLVEMYDQQKLEGVLVDLLTNDDSFARMLEAIYGVLDRARYRYQESWVAKDQAF